MNPARRFVAISAAIAAGVAAVLLLARIAFHPITSHEASWNTSAVVATFDKLDDDVPPEQDGWYRPRFRYIVQNTTRSDITLTSFRLAAKLRHQNAILMDDSKKPHLSLRMPVFMPGLSRSVIWVELHRYSSKSGRLGAEDRQEVRDQLLTDFVGGAADLAGFVIFDDRRRIRIDLPKGW